MFFKPEAIIFSFIIYFHIGYIFAENAKKSLLYAELNKAWNKSESINFHATLKKDNSIISYYQMIESGVIYRRQDIEAGNTFKQVVVLNKAGSFIYSSNAVVKLYSIRLKT